MTARMEAFTEECRGNFGQVDAMIGDLRSGLQLTSQHQEPLKIQFSPTDSPVQVIKRILVKFQATTFIVHAQNISV